MKNIMVLAVLTVLGACSTAPTTPTQAFTDAVKERTFVWTKAPGSTTDFTFNEKGDLSFPVGPMTHTFKFDSVVEGDTNKAYYVNENMMGLGKVYAGLALNEKELKVYYGTRPLTDEKSKITWKDDQLAHTAIEK